MINLTQFKAQLSPFILASGSPQRKWILEQIGVNFKIDPPDIDENLDNIPLKKPHAIVKYLALAKAQAIANRHSSLPILSCDTLVVNHKGQILGKPKTKIDAKRMLESYNGAYADIYSGLAWIYADRSKKPFLDYNKTRLYFKAISGQAIDDYLQNGEWKYCSGGMKVEKIDDWLKKRVGEYWNVVGLPVKLLEKI